MTDKEHKTWVSWHMIHHMKRGDFFTPSDDCCELAYCTCEFGVLYRKRLKELGL